MHLENVVKGYAEVYFEDKECAGCVQLEEIDVGIDYKKDELMTAKRWFAYKAVKPSNLSAFSASWGRSSYLRVGRFNTGYETRRDAINALAYVCGVDISE